MGLKILTKNISYILLARILSTLFASGSMIFLVRYLGPEKLGIYSFVITLLFIFNSFSDSGISMFLTKEMAQDRTKTQKLFSNHFSIQTVITVIAILLLCIVAHSANSLLMRNMLLIGGLGVLFNNCILPFAAVLMAHEDMKFNTISALIGGIATVLITVIGIYWQFDLYYFMLLAIIPSLISFIVVFILGVKYIKIQFSWNRTVIKKIILSSLPFFALTATGLLYSRMDLLMLKVMDSNQAAGLYNVAYKIIFFLFVIPASVRSAIYPMFANYHKNSKDKLLFAISKTIKYMLIISILISIVIFLYADSLVYILFGKQFHQSAECLKLLVWMFIPYCGYIVSMFYLNAGGDIKYVTKISLAGLIANIGLNLYLIPQYSLNGAAMATVITEIMVFLGLCFKTLNEYKAVNRENFILKLSATSISGLIIALYLPIYIRGLFFICYFILFLYMLNVVDSEEKYAFQFIYNSFLDKFRKSQQV